MNWFKRKGILFIPASIVGWLILLALLFYAGYAFINISSTEHSSGMLGSLIINCIVLFAAYSAIGYFTHRKVKEEGKL